MKYTALFLALALTGCAATVVKVLPPAALLEDCHRTELTERTNQALAKAYLGRGADIDLCNDDKRALRAWAKESQ